MKILLSAATDTELTRIVSPLHSIEYLVHGVGITNTAYSLGKKILNTKPDLCIQIGIAGSFDNSLKLGNVVMVDEDRFADFGIEDRDGSFLHISEMDFIDPHSEFTKTVLSNNNPLQQKFNWSKVKSITVNKTSGSAINILDLINRYNPQIETMEGAAFMAVCLTEKIPFIQLRAISNRVTERDKSTWNIPLAIKNLHQGINELVANLL